MNYDSPFGMWDFVASLFYYGVFCLLPVTIFSLLIHALYSLPMRRRERARLFLDVIETALDHGQSVEQTIISSAGSHDRALGVRFYLLAAYIEGGSKLGDALQEVPRFLPPQISTMLRTGEKLGDLKRVLPACREVLRDPPATVRSAIHYMLVLLLVFSPIVAWMIFLLTKFVFPRFQGVAEGMNVKLWPMTQFILTHTAWLIRIELVLFLVLGIAAAIYIGGPGFIRWFQFRRLPIVDWVTWKIPWKQKYLQRTFSAMLAVLLDGGVPETEAVRLAGDCTANEICRRRAQDVATALQQGTKLDNAVRAFDDMGEFRWRLTNAMHARGEFLTTLRGWHEALDAKAFQQEEAAAHALTSGLVILNGFVVGLIATTVFGAMIAMLNAAMAQ